MDITAFLISDSNIAAQRVKSFDDLRNQLTDIIQGSIRSILQADSWKISCKLGLNLEMILQSW